MKGTIIGSVGLVLVLWLGHAQALTGHDLMRGNNAADERFRRGYVWGVWEALSFRNAGFCIPADVTYEQIHQVVNVYLQQHPKLLGLEAAFLVVAALIGSWPCPEPSRQR